MTPCVEIRMYTYVIKRKLYLENSETLYNYKLQEGKHSIPLLLFDISDGYLKPSDDINTSSLLLKKINNVQLQIKS